MPTTITKQKRGSNKYKAISINTDSRKQMIDTVIAKYNTTSLITAEKFDINSENIGDGLVLEGATVTGNTDNITNLGNVADKSIDENGGDSSKLYYAQPIAMYGCYTKLEPAIYNFENYVTSVKVQIAIKYRKLVESI